MGTLPCFSAILHVETIFVLPWITKLSKIVSSLIAKNLPLEEQILSLKKLTPLKREAKLKMTELRPRTPDKTGY